MSDIIKFNVENLRLQKNNIDESIGKLEEVKDRLSESIEELKEDWNTNAGAAFAGKYNDGWKISLEKQIKILKELSNEINICIDEYSAAEEQFDKLTYKN